MFLSKAAEALPAPKNICLDYQSLGELQLNTNKRTQKTRGFPTSTHKKLPNLLCLKMTESLYCLLQNFPKAEAPISSNATLSCVPSLTTENTHLYLLRYDQTQIRCCPTEKSQQCTQPAGLFPLFHWKGLPDWEQMQHTGQTTCLQCLQPTA